MTKEQEAWLLAFVEKGMAFDAAEDKRMQENDAAAQKQADIDAQIAAVKEKADTDIAAIKESAKTIDTEEVKK